MIEEFYSMITKEKEEREEGCGREPKDQSRRNGYQYVVVLSITNGTISARWSLVVGRRRHLLTKDKKKKNKKQNQTHSSSNKESTSIPIKHTTIETPSPPPVP